MSSLICVMKSASRRLEDPMYVGGVIVDRGIPYTAFALNLQLLSHYLTKHYPPGTAFCIVRESEKYKDMLIARSCFENLVDLTPEEFSEFERIMIERTKATE
jgi:hypothetical protein